MTLAGFIVMGLRLTLQRMAAAGGLRIALMCEGTPLVVFGVNGGCQSHDRFSG
jgi:hypothetical protein